MGLKLDKSKCNRDVIGYMLQKNVGTVCLGLSKEDHAPGAPLLSSCSTLLAHAYMRGILE